MQPSALKATLVPLTPEAQRAVDGAARVPIVHFPFNVGRETRTSRARVVSRLIRPERRTGVTPPRNDMYLRDESGGRMHISGRHFAIECVDGALFLVDRGSACGTIVNGARVGGDRCGGQIELRDGDEVIVGCRHSPYVFRCAISVVERQAVEAFAQQSV